MRTVKEVSKYTGVSVRTLHHYDAIGLLKPAQVTEAGYRLYDDAALQRLQSILLFRQLQFPLKDIKAILDRPDFDPAEALSQQIRLLELQKKHLEELISHARELLRNGVNIMDFQAFDQSELEQYKEEAKERWGATQAYQEYEARGDSKQNFDASARQMMAIFAELGTLRQTSPADTAVQEKVAALRQFITDHYYTCTPEILRGLGQMYTGDERFRRNIDRAGGEGTADFAAQAIAFYCDHQ